MSERYNVTEMIENLKQTDVSISFEMDAENTQKLLKVTIHGLMEKCGRLQDELKNCRNELCLKCGNYHEAHNGACNGCRYRKGGEWERDIDE